MWMSYECSDEGTYTQNIRNSATRSHVSKEEYRMFSTRRICLQSGFFLFCHRSLRQEKRYHCFIHDLEFHFRVFTDAIYDGELQIHFYTSEHIMLNVCIACICTKHSTYLDNSATLITVYPDQTTGET
jgi:hypothetical protein